MLSTTILYESGDRELFDLPLNHLPPESPQPERVHRAVANAYPSLGNLEAHQVLPVAGATDSYRAAIGQGVLYDLWHNDQVTRQLREEQGKKEIKKLESQIQDLQVTVGRLAIQGDQHEHLLEQTRLDLANTRVDLANTRAELSGVRGRLQTVEEAVQDMRDQQLWRDRHVVTFSILRLLDKRVRDIPPEFTPSTSIDMKKTNLIEAAKRGDAGWHRLCSKSALAPAVFNTTAIEIFTTDIDCDDRHLRCHMDYTDARLLALTLRLEFIAMASWEGDIELCPQTHGVRFLCSLWGRPKAQEVLGRLREAGGDGDLVIDEQQIRRLSLFL